MMWKASTVLWERLYPGCGRWNGLRLQRATRLRQHQQLQHAQDGDQVNPLDMLQIICKLFCPVIRAHGSFLVSVAKTGKRSPVFTNIHVFSMVWHNARLAQDNLIGVEVRLFLIEAFNLVFFFTGRSTTTQLCPSHHCRSARRSWRSKCFWDCLWFCCLLRERFWWGKRKLRLLTWCSDLWGDQSWGWYLRGGDTRRAIGRFGKQERFCQSSSAAWSRTRAVISDLLCN